MQLEIPFKEEKVPFISEVEEFNNVMGKSYQNQTKPTINKADADFVVSFIEEELDELKEAIENKDIVEVLDAILDIAYVGLGNGAMVFGLKDKIEEIKLSLTNQTHELTEDVPRAYSGPNQNYQIAPETLIEDQDAYDLWYKTNVKNQKQESEDKIHMTLNQ